MPAHSSRCAATSRTSRTSLRGAHITVLRRSNTAGPNSTYRPMRSAESSSASATTLDRRFTFETSTWARPSSPPPDGLMPHIFVAFDQTERHSADCRRARCRRSSRSPTGAARLPAATPRPLTWSLHWAASSPTTARSPGSPSARSIVSYQTIHQDDALRDRLAEGGATRSLVRRRRRPRRPGPGPRCACGSSPTGRAPATSRPSPASPTPSGAACATSCASSTPSSPTRSWTCLLAALSEFLDAGLLALRPGRSGEIVQAHVKGILGLMVAVQSLRRRPRGPRPHHPQPRRRAGASLAPPQRGPDAAPICSSSTARTISFTVTVVEVKARQDTTAEYASNAMARWRPGDQPDCCRPIASCAVSSIPTPLISCHAVTTGDHPRAPVPGTLQGDVRQ